MADRESWSMARIRARQEPRKYVAVGPVGRQIDAGRNCLSDAEINRPSDKRVWFAVGECSTCQRCGYHVCSCARVPSRFEALETAHRMMEGKPVDAASVARAVAYAEQLLITQRALYERNSAVATPVQAKASKQAADERLRKFYGQTSMAADRPKPKS